MNEDIMSNSEAIDIAEGLIETDDLDTYTRAWQQLIDTGLAWQLQGWFGREAMRMIRGGYCSMPQEVHTTATEKTGQ